MPEFSFVAAEIGSVRANVTGQRDSFVLAALAIARQPPKTPQQ